MASAAFHHEIDLVPSIIGGRVPASDSINGMQQKPIEGVSMAYTWDKTNANAPTRHKAQYFEMLGNRAIYDDGWVAVDYAGDSPVGAEHEAAPR